MTDDPCTIRPMRASDKSAVAAMIVSLAAFHGDVGFTANVAILDCCLGRKKLADVLVALHGNSLVGFSATYDHVNMVSGHKLRHIDLIFVEAEHRRPGDRRSLGGRDCEKGSQRWFCAGLRQGAERQ